MSGLDPLKSSVESWCAALSLTASSSNPSSAATAAQQLALVDQLLPLAITSGAARQAYRNLWVTLGAVLTVNGLNAAVEASFRRVAAAVAADMVHGEASIQWLQSDTRLVVHSLPTFINGSYPVYTAQSALESSAPASTASEVAYRFPSVPSFNAKVSLGSLSIYLSVHVMSFKIF